MPRPPLAVCLALLTGTAARRTDGAGKVIEWAIAQPDPLQVWRAMRLPCDR